jgi:hypothetical protein
LFDRPKPTVGCSASGRRRRRRSFLGAFAKLRKATIRFVMSVCLSVYASVHLSAWNDSTPTGRIFMKFDILVSFENLPRKFEVSLKSDKSNGTLHEDRYAYLIYLAHFALEWVNVSTKVVEEQSTHFGFSNGFFSNRTVYAIMWKNIVERGRPPQMTI